MHHTTSIKPLYIENSHVVIIEALPFYIEKINANIFTFKEAKTFFKDLIIEEEKHLKRIDAQLTEWRNNPPYLNEETERFAHETITAIKQKIKEYQKHIYRLDMRKTHLENRNDLNVELAKTVPVTNFLNFDRSGFTKCLWHSSGQEKTGSLKYYERTNSVYCFAGCGHHDVIDVVKQINNVNFKEAVLLLTK